MLVQRGRSASGPSPLPSPVLQDLNPLKAKAGPGSLQSNRGGSGRGLRSAQLALTLGNRLMKHSDKQADH